MTRIETKINSLTQIETYYMIVTIRWKGERELGESALTVKELEEKFKLSRSTIYRLRKEGMPYYKVGGSIRFDEDEVREWLKNNQEG